MNLKKTIATHVLFADALEMGPPPKGNLAVPVFSHGSLEAELYTPHEFDPQKPHARDEIYLVARGKGEFFNGERNVKIQEGSFIFVPAGVEHRFENFSENFAAWVFFYGPEGGE
ncbi:MAG TPA: cupin domain-containing protein [Gammaproteobacteria bacterium]